MKNIIFIVLFFIVSFAAAVETDLKRRLLTSNGYNSASSSESGGNNCPQNLVQYKDSDGNRKKLADFVQNANPNAQENHVRVMVDECLLSINDASNQREKDDNDNYDGKDSSQRSLQSWTSWYGSQTGSQKLFSHNDLPIKKICVRSGSLINRIWVMWSDGYTSDQVGGTDGTQYCFTTKTNCFRSVAVRHGSRIDGLLFTTKNSHVTNYRGGSGGNANEYNFGEGYCLKGLQVYYGDYINGLSFQYGYSD
jgi:hypothetical protein